MPVTRMRSALCRSAGPAQGGLVTELGPVLWRLAAGDLPRSPHRDPGDGVDANSRLPELLLASRWPGFGVHVSRQSGRILILGREERLRVPGRRICSGVFIAHAAVVPRCTDV